MGLEGIITSIWIHLLLALFCLLYIYRSVVIVDGAREDSVGDAGRIKSPDLIEQTRRAVQRDDRSYVIEFLVNFEDNLSWKTLE